MMNRITALVCILALFATPSRADSTQVQWKNKLIPLPKECRLERIQTIARNNMTVDLTSDDSAAAYHARMLAARLGCGLNESDAVFSVRLELVSLAKTGPSSRLATLPNNDQAYTIAPSESGNGITVSALSEPGLVNGVKTLLQLIDKPDEAGAVTIPMVRITDWPDMPYRGFWDDEFPPEDIEWIAQFKLNLIDCHVRQMVNDEGRGVISRFPRKGPETVDGLGFASFCRRNGVQFVPILTHLSHLDRTGIYEKYPELIGVGASREDRFIPPCAKHETFIALLADWMEELAGRTDVDEICCWLSEVEQQCRCPECLEAGQYVMETRAILAAYDSVRKRHPDLGLRILLTQGSHPTNDKVLAEIPEDVGVIYYDGVQSYDSSRRPMIYFDLRDYAARGYSIGVCPQLVPSWAIVCPWSSPQFVRARMNEFTDKRLRILSSYVTPDLRLHDFHVMASAEWSWNANGRTPHEFARAYAEIKGFDNPVKFADWAVTLGDASWDIYGSEIPFTLFESLGTAPRMLDHRIPPVPGEGMFRYYPDAESFDTALAVCDKALRLAEELGVPEAIEETKVVRGYIAMNRELYHIFTARANPTGIATGDIPALAKRLDTLIESALDTNDALKRWQKPYDSGGGRFLGTVALNEEFSAAVCDSMASSGVHASLRNYLPQKIASWDMPESDSRTMRWNVPLDAPGTYRFIFKHDADAGKALITGVSLLGGNGGAIAEDSHEGESHPSAYRNGNTYTLSVESYDRSAVYRLEAGLKASNDESKGEIFFMKVR